MERYIGSNDIAAVLHTSGRSDATQDFTSSRSLLENAIDRFMGRKLRSASAGMIDQYYMNRGTPNAGDKLTDPDGFERGYNAESLLRTLTSLADWMGGIRGRRKSVVLFSEGIDYDIHNPFDNPYASSIVEDTRKMVGAATRNNVNVYSVDPRGLTSLGDENIEIQSMPDQSVMSPTALLDELRIAQDSLRVMADETGHDQVRPVGKGHDKLKLEVLARRERGHYLIHGEPVDIEELRCASKQPPSPSAPPTICCDASISSSRWTSRFW